MLLIGVLLAGVPAAVLAKADFSTWTPPTVTTASGTKNLVGNSAWTAWFKNGNQDLRRPTQPEITRCTGPTSNVWGASFDDGPAEGTPVLLDFFDKKSLQATFWVIGLHVTKRPELLVRAYQAGHQIGIHSWTHPKLREISDDEIIAELVYSARAVYAVIGVYPKYFRPPYGNVDDRVRNLAALVGMTSVIWSKDSQDWQYTQSAAINTIVPSNFRTWLSSGSMLDISLQHDLEQDEGKVAVTAMNMLLDAGRVIKPLSECIGDDAPYDNPILSRFFEASGLYNDRWGTNDFEFDRQASSSTASTASAIISATSFNTSTAVATQTLVVAADAIVKTETKSSTGSGTVVTLSSLLFLVLLF
ncbi:chitin deacetylase [Chytriomyces hyalinus]|nr:chitin deacetylase [Chytriomyces hyalinus]